MPTRFFSVYLYLLYVYATLPQAFILFLSHFDHRLESLHGTNELGFSANFQICGVIPYNGNRTGSIRQHSIVRIQGD
jgi:hypothetical protein